MSCNAWQRGTLVSCAGLCFFLLQRALGVLVAYRIGSCLRSIGCTCSSLPNQDSRHPSLLAG
jgi:hypothetical protein